MPIFYSHAGFSDHFEPVNSKEKIKPDDSGFYKVVQDVVCKIKYEHKHLKKKKNYYYISNNEQLQEITNRLKECNIQIEYKIFDDYIRVSKK